MPDTILDDIDALKAANAQKTQSIADHEQRIAKLESAPAATPAPAVPPTITDAQLVQALRTLLLGTAAPSGGGDAPAPAQTGGQTGPGTDPNRYPLQMPADVAPAATVVLGTGPDVLDLLISNSPGQAAPCVFGVLLVRPDGSKVGIAGPLTCSSYSGETPTGAQHFSIRGPWGSNAQFKIVPIAEGSGVLGMFLMGASLNLVPLGIWGQVNSRGGDAGGGSWTYNSNGAAMTLQLDGNPVPAGSVAPIPAATPTPINGSTLDKLAAAGGPLALAAGTIIGTAILTADLSGAGMGTTIIDGAGLRLSQDKAVLLTEKHVTISEATVRGARISAALGANGAGVRDNGPGIGFDLVNLGITGCQNGILTFASDVNLTGCIIHDNGEPGSERTHNVYVGGAPGTTFTLTDTRTSNCLDAHEVKSRAGTTISKRCHHVTGGNGVGYEFPDAGKVAISDGSITLPAGAADRRFIAYGMESTANAATGLDVTITNELFEDLTGFGGIIMARQGIGAKLVLIGCTYKGSVAPDLQGWAEVTGEITKAG
jgi:hypothetical protein